MTAITEEDSPISSIQEDELRHLSATNLRILVAGLLKR